MAALLFASILVRIAFADGSVIECETGEFLVYEFEARMVLVVGCGDRVFSDSFEG